MTPENLHGLRDRISPLHEANISVLGDRDVPIASFGGAGQSLLGNVLLELGLNYADAYTERLLPDGTSRPAEEHTQWRQRLAASHTKDSVHALPPSRCRWPRFVKTHLTPNYFTSRPLLGAWVLIRDPRDALYSRYRFRVEYAQDPADIAAGSFENWLRLPGPAGLNPIEDWNHFYDSWLVASFGKQPHAVSRFEDLKTEPSETLRRALQKFGITPEPIDVLAASERSSFSAMRAHEEHNSGPETSHRPTQRIMRKGKPGEWREWITPELMDLFAPTRTVAGRYGYRITDT
ncbi:sulfotransferase domain-containing protein [Streptomyces sp. NPDC018059]|uniref:sulfotransferase domain-containing protein n=1 Tax=Streptomyces sp. NPDC018059 TaxID=3365041 RepID=UPI0037880788